MGLEEFVGSAGTWLKPPPLRVERYLTDTKTCSCGLDGMVDRFRE